ncbi:SusC/RagA family TonB-linked outer membrane protein [Flavobacterium sp. RS13.1]|uniref:SusC/RagA family TonB-linked outer membrane protein n=1 Tax=Flavobacterium sp. RS13.1 TaxID=3400345 RepID=UPI003AAFE947
MKQTLIKRCSFILFTLMSIITYAQNVSSKIKITGTVTDNTGLLLPGVNVTEKSSKNSVTTGFDGKYEISVRPGATLVFSFIGMKKIEIPLNGRTNLDTKMQEDSNVLDDIVVVAYGKQKRNNITGAIATIKPENVQDLPVTNLSEALRGLVPGLSVNGGSGRPGQAASLEIRQTFSFSKDGGYTTPLIVIDDMVQVDPATGQPTLETFNRLDPTEIESITVLKDASAAIYGSRASQGAVVVKTKRGKVGATKFSYQQQFAINDAVSHGKVMNAYEFGVFSNRFMTARNLTRTGQSLYSQAELEEMKGLDYNWLDKAWKPATQIKHAFNISGGTEKATYFAGATYLDQGANLGNQDYSKWTFRTGVTAKISSSLDFAATVAANTGRVEKSYTKSVTLNDSSFGASAGGEQADYSILLHMPQYVPWETTVNDKTYFMSPIPRSDRNLQSANTNNNIAGWNYFATLANGSKSVNEDFSYNVNLSLNYKVPFVKGLSVKGSYARIQYSDNSEQVQLPYTLARIKNYETEGNHLASAASDSDYSIDTNTRNARVLYDNTLSTSVQSNFFVNYDRTFGNHEIGAMFAMERSESDSKKTRLYYENTPSYYAGTHHTAGTLIPAHSLSERAEGGTLSYLGRVNYAYKSKYLLTLIFRSDASTKFAPENYWGFFPSAQVGWIASKEDWFTEALPGVDFFKIRYSIGKTGKDNVTAWRWQKLYDINTDKGWQFGSNGGSLTNGLTPRVEPNRNVGWDTTIKHNLGFDVNVLKNRLQMTYDFYFDRNTEMLTKTSAAIGIPVTIGGGFAEQNYAAVDAWGAEVGLNWNDKIKNNLEYSVGVNFGFSDNEIKRYFDQALLHPSNNQTMEGRSLFFPSWGFKTWKQTSTGDGILRTDQDIQNYWNYLTERATAAGTTPNFMGVSTMSGLAKGQLAYQDIGGQYNSTDGTQAGPDGRIEHNNDYAKLVNSSRTYGFTTNLGVKYKGFYARTQIATSWGGIRMIDRVKQLTASTHNMWSHETFWNDMYAEDNVDGKYPNMGYLNDPDGNVPGGGAGAPSDFWMLDTFRCTVRNLTIGYGLPTEVLKNLNISSLTIGVTGQNLWDLYNPYPNHYRNMYDDSLTAYPTLRTWAVNLNVAF